MLLWHAAYHVLRRIDLNQLCREKLLDARGRPRLTPRRGGVRVTALCWQGGGDDGGGDDGGGGGGGDGGGEEVVVHLAEQEGTRLGVTREPLADASGEP